MTVVREGDLKKNLNHYSLYRFSADSPQPGGELLARFSSSSNRAAIEDLAWLDQDNLVFCGEQPGETRQLYAVECHSRETRKLSNYPRSLVRFSVTPDLRGVAFTAYSPAHTLNTAQARQRGLLVGTLRLPELLQDPAQDDSHRYDLVLNGKELAVPESYVLDGRSNVLALSPDGKSLVVALKLRQVNKAWLSYSDDWLHSSLTAEHSEGFPYDVIELFLVDLASGKFRPLVDAPFHPGATCAWSPDSRSVVIGASFAPLVSEGSEIELRRTKRVAYEVEVASGQTRLLGDQPLRVDRWERDGQLWLRLRGDQVVMKKAASGEWSKLPLPTGKTANYEIVAEEGLNLPPRLCAIQRGSGAKSVLLDLNPNLQEVKLGKVEEIEIPLKDGRKLSGGVFLPPEYRQGVTYPLVVQTHGWVRDKFWPDGFYPCTTSYGAQALASAGIVVVQIGNVEGKSSIATHSEGGDAMAELEGVIDDLDKKGMIDRNRVGVMGWSRTTFQVKYALTHSAYKFAAALVAEGIDAGYWQYIGYCEDIASEYESINGAMPFGEGLQSWLKSAPGFNLDKVHTPLLIHCNSRASLLPEWEWYAGLRRLHKPVEMVSLIDGVHNLFQPQHRLISQGMAVDWFRFWLTDQEDSDPLKRSQYSRWRGLRGGS